MSQAGVGHVQSDDRAIARRGEMGVARAFRIGRSRQRVLRSTKLGSKLGSRVPVRLAAMRVKLPRATFKVAAILVLSVALASPAIPAVAAGPALCATPSPTTF